VWAPSLTRGLFKRGETSKDIYLSFLTGLDGSPMPSYADKATPDELWALTHYVQSLDASSGNQASKR
jgi:cytochrome c oxidase cbb3-type subunit 2